LAEIGRYYGSDYDFVSGGAAFLHVFLPVIAAKKALPLALAGAIIAVQ